MSDDPSGQDLRGLHLQLPQGQPITTLANWQRDPHQRWAFQHMRELMPSHVVEGADHPRPLPVSLPERWTALDELKVPERDGATVNEILGSTDTDGCLVLHRGELLAQWYTPPMTPRRRHLVMSVTKSVVSCVASTLVRDGLLDPGAPVEKYVPELETSGYAGARVRTLLDMRSGIRFSEEYLDENSEVRIMERSMGWAPHRSGDPLGMYPYIATIEPEGDHDDVFTYRSIDTDTLGWVCERAASRRMADLISERIWVPMGARYDAEITADPLGFAIHDGGLSATLGDLGRFGQMLIDDGAVDGHQVVPATWLHDVLDPADDVRDAFARSGEEPYLPGGWYRSQFWVIPGDDGPIQLCLGIHGQMVFVERSTGLVGAKLSSWPLPQDIEKLRSTIAMFREVGRYLR